MKWPLRMSVRHSYSRGHKFPSRSTLARADKVDDWISEKIGRTLVRTESLPALFRRMGKDPLFRGIWERIIAEDLPYDFLLTGVSAADVLDNLNGYDSWHPFHCQHPMTTSMTVGGELIEIEYPCKICESLEGERPEPFEWLNDHWLRCFAFFAQIRNQAKTRFQSAVINAYYEKMSASQVLDHLASIDGDGRYSSACMPNEFRLSTTREVRWFPPCGSDISPRK